MLNVFSRLSRKRLKEKKNLKNVRNENCAIRAKFLCLHEIIKTDSSSYFKTYYSASLKYSLIWWNIGVTIFISLMFCHFSFAFEILYIKWYKLQFKPLNLINFRPHMFKLFIRLKANRRSVLYSGYFEGQLCKQIPISGR